MKAYTTIEESKQLIEAGLDVNTADLLYECFKDEVYGDITYSLDFVCNWQSTYPDKGIFEDVDIFIPCWSLAALIELLPDYIEYWDKEGYSYDTFLEINKHSVTYRYFNQYQNIKVQLFEAFDESLVSSVCKTIIWLLENNYIKSNKNA